MLANIDLLDFTEKLESGKLDRGDLSDSDEDDDEDEEMGFGVSDDEVDLSEGEDEEGDEGEDEDEDEDVDDSEEEEEEAESDEGEEQVDPSDIGDGSPAEPEAVPTRYVPPHMRAAMLAEKAAGDSNKALERGKLERKAQGLLNKYIKPKLIN